MGTIQLRSPATSTSYLLDEAQIRSIFSRYTPDRPMLDSRIVGIANEPYSDVDDATFAVRPAALDGP